MNAIVITRFRPDQPRGGAALRNWQNINALSRLGPVDVISIGEPMAAGEVPGVRIWRHFPVRDKPVQAKAWRRAWPVRPGVHPVVETYNHPNALAAIVEMGPYDLGVIEELALARYLQPLQKVCKRVVFDAHNVEADLRKDINLSGIVGKFKAGRLEDEERRVIKGADVVWACSEIDAERLRALYQPRGAVTLVPNCVQVEAYDGLGPTPIEAQAASDDRSPKEGAAAPLSLLYPGTFSYSPNEVAAMSLVNDVLPALRRAGINAQIVLAGRMPTRRMEEAAQADGDVIVTGEVDSMLPYLQAASAIVLPITVGSGTRLKILEAFAARRPVITTPKGVEGVDIEDGREVLVASNADDIVAAVKRLVQEQGLSEALCAKAFALVNERYSWKAAGEAIALSLA